MIKHPEMKNVKLSEITMSKTNPRQYLDEESLKELSASVKEKGVLSPIVIRPFKGVDAKLKYELVFGERRYRASALAKLEEIPAIIREMTDQEVLEAQIIENLQRKDVSPIEEAIGFKNILDTKKYNVKELAIRVGKSEQYVAIRIKLNDLIAGYQEAIHKNRLTLQDAIWLCRLSKEDQEQLYKEKNHKTAPVQIGDYIRRQYTNDLNEAPFKLNDADLVKEAGACSACSFNSANVSTLFPELSKGKAICQKSACFKNKFEVYFDHEIKKAQEDPEIIFVSSEYYIDGNKKKQFDKLGIIVYASEHYDTATKKNPKAKRAFVVDGGGQGKYIYVELEKEKKSASKNTADKPLTGKAAELAIAEEIKGMKEREKRKKELEENRVHQEVFEGMLKEKSYVSSKAPLSLKEKKALIIILLKLSRSYGVKVSAEKAFAKATGIKNDYNNNKLYQALDNLSLSKLNEAGNVITRCMIMEALEPGKESRPSNSDHASILQDIFIEQNPKGMKELIATKEEAAKKREERLAERISLLK